MTTVTVPSHLRPDNEQISEALLTLVRNSLRGDEIIIKVAVDGDPNIIKDFWEARYSVAWQSEGRARKQITEESEQEGGVGKMRDCGTHIACLTNNPDAVQILVWGHYDLSTGDALRDCTERARPTH